MNIYLIQHKHTKMYVYKSKFSEDIGKARRFNRLCDAKQVLNRHADKNNLEVVTLSVNVPQLEYEVIPQVFSEPKCIFDHKKDAQAYQQKCCRLHSCHTDYFPIICRPRTSLPRASKYSREEKWDRRFLELAKLVSTWSKDPSTQVGAVLVNDLKQVVGMGYNGFARGIKDSTERLNNREIKYEFVVHAEVNAIIQAGQNARNSTLYVYPSFMLPPICANCAKAAIQAGIKAIVGYKPNENDERVKRWANSVALAREMFDEVSIPCRSYNE